MSEKLDAIARQEAILRLLEGGETIPVEHFIREFGCSYGTIRNDLEYLQEKGMLIRTHGGAVRTDRTPIITMDRRIDYSTESKRGIAKKALEAYVRPNETIILDSGTTTLEMAKLLAVSNIPLTVVTQSVSIIWQLRCNQRIRILTLGGCYDGNSDAFCHPGDMKHMRGVLRADTYFMGFNGIYWGFGFAHGANYEQEIKRYFITLSNRVVAVGNSEKLNQNALWLVGSFEEVSALITDEGVSEEQLQMFHQRGVDVVLARRSADGHNTPEA